MPVQMAIETESIVSVVGVSLTIYLRKLLSSSTALDSIHSLSSLG
jgi:hypothetical protein